MFNVLLFLFLLFFLACFDQKKCTVALVIHPVREAVMLGDDDFQGMRINLRESNITPIESQATVNVTKNINTNYGVKVPFI